MMLPRWERHWWQRTEPLKTVPREPTVWVDPSLYDERPPRRLAHGTIPPPTCVGAYCRLREDD